MTDPAGELGAALDAKSPGTLGAWIAEATLARVYDRVGFLPRA